jgi:hypothetical protein
MAIEDVQKAIAEEIAAQESQKGTQSDTKQTQASEKNQSANEKRKKDALRKLQSLEILYDRYIGELASGKRKSETLSPRKLKEIEEAAVRLSDEIKGLNRIINPPPLEKEAMVGNLPTSRVPFGGKQVGGATVSEPITSAVNTSTKTPAKKKKKKKGIPEGFDVARARMGEEASMAALTPELASATGEMSIEEIYNLVKTKYANIDSIFLYNDELGNLLREAVGNIDDPKDDMASTEFTRRLGLTDWAKTGAEEWRTRSAEKREYKDLLGKFENQLALAATDTDKAKIQEKIDTLKSKSTYARGVASSKAAILKIASGLIGTPSPEILEALATEIYDSAIEDDPNLIRDKVLARFKYTPDAVLGGSAGANLTALKQAAAANGFDLQEVYGDKLNDWITRMAQGESVETFKSLIRDRAAIGLPDKVANLLRQGLDLEDIYSPYRNIMASVLELEPDSIKLTDPALTNAFGADRELPLYEFKRSLRKDARWQYTDNAREEVSTAALGILRDFGFQG